MAKGGGYTQAQMAALEDELAMYSVGKKAPPPHKELVWEDVLEGDEDEAERVAEARAALAKGLPDLPAAELDIAELALVKLVNKLRGSEGEVCVQSYALLAKKLAASDPRPRVVIAVRLNAGIAMPVALLKACLGECWKDGLITTRETLHGISEVDLPYSAEARAAIAFGNAPLLLVTSVATR